MSTRERYRQAKTLLRARYAKLDQELEAARLAFEANPNPETYRVKWDLWAVVMNDIGVWDTQDAFLAAEVAIKRENGYPAHGSALK